MISRRRFVAISGAGAAAMAFGSACGAWTAPVRSDDGRLGARPPRQPKAGLKMPPAGQQAFGLRSTRDAVLRVPDLARVDPARRVAWAAAPPPVLVLFHGAGGSAERMLARIAPYTDAAGVVVLSLSSTDATWDAIRGGFGPDAAHVDQALKKLFDTMPVDPKRLTAGGFSDGASYALSIGVINGDVFRRVAAFSPGFIIPGPEHDRPEIFISHGIEDNILPYERCGKRLAGELTRDGYKVTFRDFHGSHEIPPDIGKAGAEWIASTEARG